MKYINEEDINRIRLNANIVDVIASYGIKLTKTGKDNYLCLCPFHDDHNPNMIISEKKQIYKCFGGCGAGGNVFKFVQDYENVSFAESVKIVANKTNQEFNYNISSYENKNVKYIDEYKLMDLSLKFYQNNLFSEKGVDAQKYLNNRGITNDIINNFKIGLSLDNNSLKKFLENKKVDLELAYNLGLLNKSGIEYYDVYQDRIMVPIFNDSGYLCGYTGRCYLKDEKNKYVNTKETNIYKKSEILFNYYNAKEQIIKLREIILVEGNMDAISLSSKGIKNVCALMGVVLSTYQIDLIKKLKSKVILMLDSDNAGSTATIKVGDALYQKGIDVRVVRLTGAKDPDEYIQKNGVNALNECIKNAQKYIDFKIENLKLSYNLSSVEDVTNYVKTVINDLNYTSDIEKEVILNKISKEFNIDIDILKKQIPKKEIIKPIKIEKEVKKKSKYLLSSSKMIYAMLLHKEYYRIYMNNLGYLKDIIQRKTVSLIGSYIEKYNNIDIAGFMDYVVEYEDVLTYINEIITENNEEDIDEKEYKNIINVTSKSIDLEDIKKLKNEIDNEKDINEKIKLMEKLRKLKEDVVKNEGN